MFHLRCNIPVVIEVPKIILKKISSVATISMSINAGDHQVSLLLQRLPSLNDNQMGRNKVYILLVIVFVYIQII